MPYIVVSNTFVKEVDIIREGSGFSVVRFSKGEGNTKEESAIRLRNSRIFKTKEEAEAHALNHVVKKAPAAEPSAPHRKNQYDYADEYLQEQMKRGRYR